MGQHHPPAGRTNGNCVSHRGAGGVFVARGAAIADPDAEFASDGGSEQDGGADRSDRERVGADCESAADEHPECDPGGDGKFHTLHGILQ